MIILNEKLFKERCYQMNFKCLKCGNFIVEIKRKKENRIFGYFCLKCDEYWINKVIKYAIKIGG